MKLKMQYRLILSYFTLTLIIIGLISFLVNSSVKKGFENYIIEEHRQLVTEITKNVEQSHSASGFDLHDIEHLGIEAIEKGLIISIYDSSDTVVWSAMEHNAGLCESMITNIRENMFDHYSNWDGNYTEDTYALISDGHKIGKINIGYLGPFYFNEEELYFLSSINQILIFVGLFSLLIAGIIGTLISRGLTKPMAGIVHHLNHIHDPSESSIPDNLIKTTEIHDLYEASRKLEMRIMEQEQLRKQLTQDMAHELKTPLTTIQGQLEAMIDGIFPLTKERLESSHEEILRIKSLITDIESLSVIENNNTALSVSTFDLYELIKEVMTEFENALLYHDISYKIDYTSPKYKKHYTHFSGDANKLKQVFINLTSNAIKYAGRSTAIHILLDHENDMLNVHYQDNGKGIPEKDLPYIFERFYRVDPSRTGHHGLGIGLTLVRSIVERHSGKINLESTFGQGTHFTIMLPLLEVLNFTRVT